MAAGHGLLVLFGSSPPRPAKKFCLHDRPLKTQSLRMTDGRACAGGRTSQNNPPDGADNDKLRTTRQRGGASSECVTTGPGPQSHPPARPPYTGAPPSPPVLL